MGDFKFSCPHCGQKISCDSSYGGAQIPCPACQQTFTAPLAPPAAAGPPVAAKGPPPIPASASAPRTVSQLPSAPPPRAPSSPTTAKARSAPDKDRYSLLALASLFCSVWICFGFVPGIICGHLARARMRRNIFLKGEGLATAGLTISYVVLSLLLIFSSAFALVQWHNHPIRAFRESPEEMASLKPRIVDEVLTDAAASEEEHDLQGLNMQTTVFSRQPGRSAVRGGSFSYVMKVLPDRPMSLNCRYSGSEKKGHTFDIAVDDQIIATQNLYFDNQGHFLDLEYKIPAGLTHGKAQVKVEFLAHSDGAAGALYGCQMLKR